MQATVTQVPIGNIEIEGLLLEDGTFAVGIPQLASLNLVPANRSIKELEVFSGMRFQSPIKTKTKLNPKAINAISIKDLEELIVRMSAKGNQVALNLNLALVGLSLTQLFSDAFGIKFETEDRQAWLKDRQATKDSFWFLVADIDQYIETYGSSAPQWHYINAFKAMSQGLFGKIPSDIKKELGIGSGELNRDHFGNESLRRIDCIQRLAKTSIAKGTKPTKAVQEAIVMFDYKPIDYTA